MLMDEEEKMLAMLQLGFWPLFDARSRVNKAQAQTQVGAPWDS